MFNRSQITKLISDLSFLLWLNIEVKNSTTVVIFTDQMMSYEHNILSTVLTKILHYVQRDMKLQITVCLL